jgi:NitT/TauT family transport system substrate-binding protein
VTIVPGGPQVNNQALMLAGRLDFYMGGVLDAFFAVQEDLPIVNVAAMFQKDPQVLLTHPGAVSSFEELKSLPTLMISDGGLQLLLPVDEERLRLHRRAARPYTYNARPSSWTRSRPCRAT